MIKIQKVVTSFIFCYSRRTISKAYWQCISMVKSASTEEVCSHSMPAHLYPCVSEPIFGLEQQCRRKHTPVLSVTVTGLLANHQKKKMAQRGSDAQRQGRILYVSIMHGDLCNLAAASLSGLTKLQVVIYIPLGLQHTSYSVCIL